MHMTADLCGRSFPWQGRIRYSDLRDRVTPTGKGIFYRKSACKVALRPASQWAAARILEAAVKKLRIGQSAAASRYNAEPTRWWS
jgi:hypothetical protein